jgi:hypothetical protein
MRKLIIILHLGRRGRKKIYTAEGAEIAGGNIIFIKKYFLYFSLDRKVLKDQGGKRNLKKL